MSQSIWRADVSLLPGELVADARPVQIRTIVGSCVAVCLWDRRQHVGGVNHFLLPEPLNGDAPSTQYGNQATTELIAQVCRLGATRESLEASVIGGGSPMQAIQVGAIGERNTAMALAVLRHHGIRVVRQDTGGSHGRKLLFNPKTGELVVRMVRGIAAVARGAAQ